MCRLFGFRSVINSQVHSSLVQTENALSIQSNEHPDGWGVAYYREGVPHLIKSVKKAVDDQIFMKVSGIVKSQTVLAHIRKATQGQLSLLNSHPFQYGKWVFAHNGNLKNFNSYKSSLLNYIDVELRSFILGHTDSEVIFYLLLSLIKKKSLLSASQIKFSDLKDVIETLCHIITSYSGELYGGGDNNPEENHLTFILTSGDMMVALQGGQNLSYSTHKSRCPDRESCRFLEENCESKADHLQKVNHLILSSENLKGENMWYPLSKGELVGVDSRMNFHKLKINIPFSQD